MTRKRTRRASEAKAAMPSHCAPKPASSRTDVDEGIPVAEEVSPSFSVVGIGASAGGLEAFTQLLGGLPIDTGMAFVLVQHLSASHPSALAEILSVATKMPVNEVRDEDRLEPNSVYVLPPGHDMVVSKYKLLLRPREPGRLYKPIDRFLCSLAEELRHKSIGVVLSGTATDGTSGLEAIRGEGGITFAQDATAQCDGMPRSAIDAGCVDFIMPPWEIADEIASISRHSHSWSRIRGPDLVGEPDLAEVITVLHERTGVDFSGYKPSMLCRRITRRMALSKSEGLVPYLGLLRDSPAEVDALFQDVLIHLTHFFRDPSGFETLKSRVFPELIGDRNRREPVRIWTLGCSTGEEVYSLAMAFTEFAETWGTRVPLQIFATDLNDRNIQKARAAVYSPEHLQNVSPDRLARFFVDADDHYRIAKSIRDLCVFSKHNVLSDPPFSRIDLISCRNLLIYLDRGLQQRVLPLLHYALKPSGFLWLGSSETVGPHRDLFEAADTEHKVYVKKPRLGPAPPLFSLKTASSGLTDLASQPFRGRVKEDNLEAEADQVLAARFAPPSVLLSADYEVQKFRGDTSPYLAHMPGKASLNLLKMLRGGLLVGVRSALQRAAKDGIPAREEGLQIKSDDAHRKVDVEVIPLKGNDPSGSGFLLLFEEATPSGRSPSTQEDPNRDAWSQTSAQSVTKADDFTITLLKQELAATHEYLQSLIEQQEVINEELQSANEEVQSSNEELQSTNEELETSKEEIQSSNEELATINDELNNRNAELDRLNNDLMNLLSSVEIPIVIFGTDLCVRRYTPSAARLFGITSADLGRPISSLRSSFYLDDIERLLRDVYNTAFTKQCEVRDEQGHWYSLRVRPYKTLDNRIDGVVLMMVDVDTLKRAQEYTESIVSTVRESLLVLESDFRVRTASRSFYTTFGVTREATEGQSFFALLEGRWDQAELRGLLEEVASRDSSFSDLELQQELEPGLVRTLSFNARRLLQESDRSPAILLAIADVSELKRVEQALKEGDRRKDEFLAMLSHELRNPLATISYAEQMLRMPGMKENEGWCKEVIGNQVNHLRRLIDDLLDLSRINHGKISLKIEQVSLAAVIDRAVKVTRHLVEERNHQLTVSIEPESMTLDADPIRLEQILANLVTNAAKYTANGGRIALTARHEGDDCVVRVTDNGQGLSAEMLTRAFDPFIQFSGAHDRSRGGIGIGLTLVKNLTELHGGSVQATSPGIGLGSEFTVRLPLPKSPEPETPTPVTEPENSLPPRSRILVVEDSLDAARGLARLLRHDGHEVGTVHDGLTALQAARQERFDFILLDVGLPGLSGYEVASELRKEGQSKTAVIIAISGYGLEEDRRRSRAAGIDHHLVKPIDYNALLTLLSRSP